MINFSLQTFYKIWDSLAAQVTPNWDVGRVRKSAQRPADFVRATNVHEAWSAMERFERNVQNQASFVRYTCYRVSQGGNQEPFLPLVDKAEEKYSMKKLMEQISAFSNFKYARYAKEVNFHQIKRPTGIIHEAKG